MYRVSFILLLILCFGTVSSCILDSAKPSLKKELVVGYTSLTETDSSIIKEFEKKYNCAVTLKYISASDYLELSIKKPYNTGFDVVFISNDSIREQLQLRGSLYAMHRVESFGQLERQFQNKHKLWLPLCHDPLVITRPTDSLKGCSTLNFSSWHQKDSLKPHIYKTTQLKNYLFTLSNSKFIDIIPGGKQRRYSGETAWQLSQLAEIQLIKDTTYLPRQHACKFVVTRHMRSVTCLTTLSIGKYARNRSTAILFVEWFGKRNAQVASAKNQLPCNTNSQPNYTIRNLSLIF